MTIPLLSNIVRKWIEPVKLLIGTLFYNHLCDFDYIIDVCMGPAYYFVDHYTGILGPAFVAVCCFIILDIITISYWIGLPYWWKKNWVVTIFLLIFGNWLMVNCIFHYYMGITCGPGHPSQVTFVKESAGVCKKCISPKPQRTHHCSVCRMCILMMDHHCPWLNNCVGYYNCRYFFLFIVYTIGGVIFLMIFGFEIAYKELWLGDTNELYGVSVIDPLLQEGSVQEQNDTNTQIATTSTIFYTSRKKCIIFAAFTCLDIYEVGITTKTNAATRAVCRIPATVPLSLSKTQVPDRTKKWKVVFFALGYLLIRHTRLISRGETTIEMYINRSERQRLKSLKQVYLNPYNFGCYKNWCLFLGINFNSGRTWRHILLPSAHKPFGNGFTWPNINSPQEEWAEFFHHKTA